MPSTDADRVPATTPQREQASAPRENLCGQQPQSTSAAAHVGQSPRLWQRQPATLLALQRTIGNRAVSRLLAPPASPAPTPPTQDKHSEPPLSPVAAPEGAIQRQILINNVLQSQIPEHIFEEYSALQAQYLDRLLDWLGDRQPHGKDKWKSWNDVLIDIIDSFLASSLPPSVVPTATTGGPPTITNSNGPGPLPPGSSNLPITTTTLGSIVTTELFAASPSAPPPSRPAKVVELGVQTLLQTVSTPKKKSGTTKVEALWDDIGLEEEPDPAHDERIRLEQVMNENMKSIPAVLQEIIKSKQGGNVRILILSDSEGEETGQIPIKPVYEGILVKDAKKGITYEVVGTDFNPSPGSQLQKVDNTQQFPFDANSFDLILLRDGICYCKKEGACALKQEGAETGFLQEVIRVLAAHPKAAAYMSGKLSGLQKVDAWKRWKQAAEAVRTTFPDVTITLIPMTGSKGPPTLGGIKITKTQSV